jgi:hypothetical protein
MHPAATLFLDVCVQPDLWPDGVWPLVDAGQARNVAALFSLASRFAVRQGGVVCRHGVDGRDDPEDVPPHCRTPDASLMRPPGCEPRLPVRLAAGTQMEPRADALDRTTAVYLDTGCQRSCDEAPSDHRAFRYLTSGVREAVVFGAGVEFGIDRAVNLLLASRIRTHVVLDAVGAADEVLAQTTVARWKRRGVDGITVATLERLLLAAR